DRTTHGGERIRTLDRRDVPDVPPASARCAAGRRSRDRQRHSAAVSPAEAAGRQADSEDRRGMAAVPVGGFLVSLAKSEVGSLESEVIRLQMRLQTSDFRLQTSDFRLEL